MLRTSSWGKLVKFLLIALVSMSMIGGASDHAKMEASVPGDGETIAAGLSQIELRFGNKLRLTLVRVWCKTSDGNDQITVTGIPKTFTTQAKVFVTPLEAGDYNVIWTGVGKDGHVMEGSFSFKVSEG